MAYTITHSFITFVLCISILSSLFNHVHAQGKTDTITWGGSNGRSGYQTNHNMDPAVVGSSQFGLLFKTQLPGTYSIKGQDVPEQIFSQPLVYTDKDGVQYVYVATTQNNIYKLNAKTGAIVASQNIHRPFLVSDLDGCVDINPTIGITSTGVIDPATDIWYLTAKTYADQNMNGQTGKSNGRYYLHAINTNDLKEQSGFPIGIEGTVPRNNPLRSFSAGIHHQRPALLHVGQYIYAGFASHCAQYNFTGWIFGWDKTSGKIVERFTTEGAGVGSNVPGGGVWMSGGGLASDNKGSMFFATGNGYASQLSNTPVNGRNPPTSLEEAAIHMAINEDGSLQIVDFFMPWEKPQLDGGDRDLGTTPLQILPNQFQCGNITRMGVVTGKSGKTYWLNLDNLGGYQNGPNKLDNVIQVYQNENSVYAGAGVYPLEGGYIYINVIQYPSHVFKFSCTNGVPSFSKVADTINKNAYTLGVGHGTVTSLDGKPGTGLVWTSDVEGSNLRIYNAVPVEGILQQIKAFNVPGTTKFTRPVFGNGIVYQGTTLGYIYAFGAPVNLPLNCTSLDFGTININASSESVPIQCRANTAVTISNAALAGNPNFIFAGLSNLPLQLGQGQQISFQAKFVPQSVGPLSSTIILSTTQQDQSYSINTPVQLRGIGQSQSPLLMVNPTTVSWNGVITGENIGGINQSVIFSNQGNSNLTVTSIRFSTNGSNGPWTAGDGSKSVMAISAFTFYGLPDVIQANSALTIPINFNPLRSGAYAVSVQVQSNGGVKVFDVLASGSELPRALLEFQTQDGTWQRYDNSSSFTFGDVLENTSRYLKLRLSNVGTINAAALSVTVSKPPFGIPESIIQASNQVDLGEGTLVYAGQNITATLYCSVPKSQINVDSYNGTAHWTMNLNDPSFGKQQIQFTCNAVSEQVPPLDLPTKQGLYRYAGCFQENNPGRQLQAQIYAGNDMTNELCISKCSAAGYIFAGTQYNQQCWCGFNRPKAITTDNNCGFACTGNINQICGGNGISGTGAYISLFGDTTRWNGNSTDIPGPYVNPGSLGFRSIGCYTEGSNTRALSQTPNSNNTVLGCLKACQGYFYAGLEYGGQCYCGNSLGIGSVSTSSNDCGMTCNNNQTEYCGGPSRLNMYTSSNGSTLTSTSQGVASTTTLTNTAPSGLDIPPTINNFGYVSCYSEATNGRALNAFTYADNSVTLTTCANKCKIYQYFAVEYGRECYCDNTLAVGSVSVTDGRCNMPCAGNSTMTCGGPNGLQLYRQLNVTSSTTTFSTTSFPATVSSTTLVTTTTTRTTSSTVPTGPSIVPQVANFVYVDCYSEATNTRALTGKTYVATNMTVDICANYCAGFAFMAVEYSSECYCGNMINQGSTIVKDGRCSMICAGDQYKFCGGANGLSLYQYNAKSNITTSSTTDVTSSSLTTTLRTTAATIMMTTSSTVSIISSTTLSMVTSTPVPYSFANTTTSSMSNGMATVMNTTSMQLSTSSYSVTSSSTTAAGTISSSNPSSLPSSSSPSGTASTTMTTMAVALSSSVSTGFTSIAVQLTTLPSSSGSTNPTTAQFSSTMSSTTNSPITLPSTPTSMSTVTTFSSLLLSTMTTITRVSQTTTTSTFGTIVSTTPSVSPSPSSASSTSPWIYLGCANETTPRALSFSSYTSSNMTVTQCQTFCSSRSPPLPLAGLQYARECYCGYSFSSTSVLGQSGCSIPCSGNRSEVCGGSGRLSVYRDSRTTAPNNKDRITVSSSTSTSPTSTNATNQNNNTNTTYAFKGCFTDTSPASRTLSSYSFTNPTNMTQELCVSGCAERGFKFAGVEYASECYCADTIFNATTKVDELECDMLCKGDSSEWCGGRGRIGVWGS